MILFFIVPAYFKNKFSSQTVRHGESVEWNCEVNGEQTIDLQVSKDRMILDFVPINNNNNDNNDNYSSKSNSASKILHSDNRYNLIRRL